jgi:hypothetical protein
MLISEDCLICKEQISQIIMKTRSLHLFTNKIAFASFARKIPQGDMALST